MFEQDLPSLLQTAGILNFSLAKPCYRRTALNLLAAAGTGSSPEPGQQYRRKTAPSPSYSAQQSSEWSHLCVPWKQEGCSPEYGSEDEESCIAEFLLNRENSLRRLQCGPTAARVPISPAPAPPTASGSRETKHVQWQLQEAAISPASGPCTHLQQQSKHGQTQATHRNWWITHSAGRNHAPAQHRMDAAGSESRALLSSGSDSSSNQRVNEALQQVNTQHSRSTHRQRLSSDQPTSTKRPADIRGVAVDAQAQPAVHKAQNGPSQQTYTALLQRRHGANIQLQHKPQLQLQQSSRRSSSSSDGMPGTPQVRDVRQQQHDRPAVNSLRQRQAPATARRNHRSTTADRSHPEHVSMRCPSTASSQPSQHATPGCHQQQTGVRTSHFAVTHHWQRQQAGRPVAAGKAALLGALSAAAAANHQAAAALSAAAKSARGSAGSPGQRLAGGVPAMADEAVASMVLGWYIAAEDEGSSMQDGQYTTACEQQTLQQKRQQQQQAPAVAGQVPTVGAEPSSSSTWSGDCPCSARCICGVGYTTYNSRGGTGKCYSARSCSCAGSEQQQVQQIQQQQGIGSKQQPQQTQLHPGSKAVQASVLAGVQDAPLQELVGASSIIDRLEHGLGTLKLTAAKFSEGGEVVSVPLRQRYGSPTHD